MLKAHRSYLQYTLCICRRRSRDNRFIELVHCIALSSFDALRETKKVFLLCRYLTVGYRGERERDLGLTYLHVREFRLQPGIDFYMEMPGLVEREAFFV